MKYITTRTILLGFYSEKVQETFVIPTDTVLEVFNNAIYYNSIETTDYAKFHIINQSIIPL